LNLVVVTPHFAPDVAPTGAVLTRITEELAALGHTIEVVTSLPWYREHRVEPGFEGRLTRMEDTPWGRIHRIHPFPATDKRHIVRRAAAFAGFSALAAGRGARGGAVDGVLAVSPPLTLALTGWAIARRRRGSFVFNVQDVYPDVAVELGVIEDRRVQAAASRLERFCYERADAVTVLSDDLRQNISPRMSDPGKIEVIPNFVDTSWITPADKENDYRREFGLEGKVVVMYAGNVGLSQSLGLVIDAAAALSHDERIAFVINGQGAARADLERRAQGLANVVFVDMQPAERLPEVLAAADIHLVPLKKGLARSSVPSKIYSILAAGRPLVASIDEGSEVARTVEQAGCGIAVPPEDPEAFVKAIRALAETPEEADKMGAAGRAFVEDWASPQAVARAYEALFTRLRETVGSVS
jgi:colanic acid biosynthesis glycosyl transferase WcaI